MKSFSKLKISKNMFPVKGLYGSTIFENIPNNVYHITFDDLFDKSELKLFSGLKTVIKVFLFANVLFTKVKGLAIVYLCSRKLLCYDDIDLHSVQYHTNCLFVYHFFNTYTYCVSQEDRCVYYLNFYYLYSI